jgi:hypothetical protein
MASSVQRFAAGSAQPVGSPPRPARRSRAGEESGLAAKRSRGPFVAGLQADFGPLAGFGIFQIQFFLLNIPELIPISKLLGNLYKSHKNTKYFF